MRKLPVVIVQWDDHASIDAWQDGEEAKKNAVPKTIHSIGWLHHEDDKVYSLVGAICSDEDVGTQQIILKGPGTKILKRSNPTRKKRSKNENLSSRTNEGDTGV